MILTVLGQYGPYPAPGGACSGYLLSSDSGRTHLMLDAGPGTMGQLFTHVALEELSAVVLTHLHFDHMSDMLAMRYALDFSRRAALDVYAPNQPVAVRSLLTGGKMDLIEPQGATVGEMRLSFIEAVHPAPVVCVCVECDGKRVVYTGDTNYFDALSLFAGDADLLLADAGCLSGRWNQRSPHMSAELCGRLARECGARQLVLTHLSPQDEPDAVLEEARAHFAQASVAQQAARYFI